MVAHGLHGQPKAFDGDRLVEIGESEAEIDSADGRLNGEQRRVSRQRRERQGRRWHGSGGGAEGDAEHAHAPRGET